jgi:uncharacterized protein
LPRPRKPRFVGFWPPALQFEPQGLRGRERPETVTLSFEELEALRLADLEGLEQAECARELGVSQSTIQRMLRQAHRRVAEALVLGKTLRIDPGTTGASLLEEQLALIQARVDYLRAWLEEIEDRTGSGK